MYSTYIMSLNVSHKLHTTIDDNPLQQCCPITKTATNWGYWS